MIYFLSKHQKQNNRLILDSEFHGEIVDTTEAKDWSEAYDKLQLDTKKAMFTHEAGHGYFLEAA